MRGGSRRALSLSGIWYRPLRTIGGGIGHRDGDRDRLTGPGARRPQIMIAAATTTDAKQ